jgi:hypothetical protein
MNTNKLVPIIGILMIVLAIGVIGAQINSTSYEHTITISQGGLTNISSSNYSQDISIGNVIGRTSSDTYNLSFGFIEAVTGLTDPTLVSPEHNSQITNRSPLFNWTSSTGSANIKYELLIQRVSCQDLTSCETDLINISNIEDTDYVISDILDVDAVYNWTVRANSSAGYSDYAPIFNFTVDSLVSLKLTTDSVDFGNLNIKDNDNTTDDSPAPLVVENDGNVFLNISIYANESLWTQQPLNTTFFRFKADNGSETISFNSTSSQTDWFNMTSYSKGVINYLNFTDSTDSAEIDLYIQVPDDEPSGTKTCTLVIESEII